MDRQSETEIQSYLSSRRDVAFALLFGSAASGRQTEESDTDIALYFVDPEREGPPALQVEAEVSFDQEEEVWRELERLAGTEVDLLLLNRAPATVCSAVLLDGRTLVVRDRALYLRYYLAVTQQAEDFRETFREFIEVRDRSRSLSEQDRYRLERISHYLEDELSDAELYTEVDKRRYLKDAHFRRALERWVENLVNASIDIAKIVVAAEELPAPRTYRETLSALEAVDPFSPLADRLAHNARTRNVLAHEYFDMRFGEVARIAREDPDLYRELARAVEHYLRTE